jgi:hypothetical protein
MSTPRAPLYPVSRIVRELGEIRDACTCDIDFGGECGNCATLREAADRLTLLDAEPEQGWQDIGTAPGMENVLVSDADGICVAYRALSGVWWYEDHRIQPTHWMPLPAPPRPSSPAAEEK